MSDSISQQLWLGISAFAAGVINSVAGGGTLLTFPALLAALSSLGSRGRPVRQCHQHGRSGSRFARRRLGLSPGDAGRSLAGLLLLLGPSLIGGAGRLAAAARASMRNSFRLLIPWLILTAALLFMVQPAVARLIQAKPHAVPSRNTIAAIVFFQFLVSPSTAAISGPASAS